MFLVKNLWYDYEKAMVVVEEGINCLNVRGRIEIPNCFWGKSEAWLGECANVEDIFHNEDKEGWLVYVNEITKETLEDGWVKLLFNVSTYEENIEGYLIFVKYCKNIKTDGEILFSRYHSEVVAKLKEGQYISLNGKKLEVINGKLMMYV